MATAVEDIQDTAFAVDLMFEASLPTPAAVRAHAFVTRFPEHAELVDRLWERHFGSPSWRDY